MGRCPLLLPPLEAVLLALAPPPTSVVAVEVLAGLPKARADAKRLAFDPGLT